jgi:hypothetical protein
VVEVGGGEAGLIRDFAHAGAGEPARPEDRGRGLEDAVTPGIPAPGLPGRGRRISISNRTAVRFSNHGSKDNTDET